MNKIGKGFKWAKREHKWETRTNGLMIICVTLVWLAYHYKTFSAEFGLISVTLISFVHLIARICHKMEQHYLRDMRHPKKKK